MNRRTLPESIVGMNRTFTVHFSEPNADDRAEIEQFIHTVFFQAYGAKISHFMPRLMSLRDLEGKLFAACGLRDATHERLFLETYTDQPIEQLLSARVGIPVPRKDIIEIGNFSVAEMGMARLLNGAIFDQLHATSKHWAVFTGVQLLRNALIKSDITPEFLCDVDKQRLPLEEQADWGSYYEQKPQVMAIERSESITEKKMQPALIAALARQCAQQPDVLALVGEKHTFSYGELGRAIEQISALLHTFPAHTLGLALDNSALWAVLDLAGLASHKVIIPLPFFFSAEQIAHSILDAGITSILTDQPAGYEQILSASGIETEAVCTHIIGGREITELRLANIPTKVLPEGTVKVTYTSGTTGHPKGVCLSANALYQVAESLRIATHAQPGDQHVSVLPFATLLENLAGIYVPLLAGATCHLQPLATVGLSGSSGLDVQKMLGALIKRDATSTILTPQLLHALIAALEAGHPKPAHLRFVAIGGATVSERLLLRAEALKLPVFEGYGLSECASVVALNTESAHRIGSVGRPLPHNRLKFSADGEILVAGSTLLGYIGDEPVKAGDYWPTGDIGFLDDEGYLHLSGRKKNIFITSFGRNVSPEWVERELTLYPAIAQAAVFGEGRPWNTAVIVPRGTTPEGMAAVNLAIAEANRLLPDYAQVKCWLPANAPFLPQNGQLTANGRLKRDAIWAQYASEIEKFYC